MNELISVIVPIYKVEQYLEDCINSLVSQTYKNIEIILVNDGSPDNCGKICDGYALQDERVRVIHKKNGGLSDARNTGLDIASGEYILFIDSDDYVAVEMVEELYKFAKKNGADVSVCYFQKFYEDNHRDMIVEADDLRNCCSPVELLKYLYITGNSPIAFVAWNKLYKRTLFEENGIQYPKGKYHEDTFTTYKLLYCASKIAVVKKPLYFYRIRSGSIMTEGFSEKRLDNLEAMQEELRFYADRNEVDLLTLALNRYCKVSLSLYDELNRLEDKRRRLELKRKLRFEYRQNWEQYNWRAKLPLKKKLVYGCLCNDPIGVVFRSIWGKLRLS